MGPKARVWRIYLDAAEQSDAEMTNGFRDTTDVLLVFAGLFSAVVTTFVSQSSLNLRPDYAQITASLMSELVSIQRAAASGSPISDVQPSELSYDSATTNTVDYWVNGLWFTSLALSLVVALIAVLVKQWLQHYNSALSGTPRQRVLLRHFKFMGLYKWKVPAIIAVLPILLHTSLFMFLAGLVVFIQPQSSTIAWVVCGITSVFYVLYLVSNILAGLLTDCSYNTPVSDIISYLKQIVFSVRLISPRLDRGPPPGLRRVFAWFGIKRWPSYNPKNIKLARDLELEHSGQKMDELLNEALQWLYHAFSDAAFTDAVCQSFAGIPFHLCDSRFGSEEILATIRERFWSLDFAKDWDQTEIILRSTVLNQPAHPRRDINEGITRVLASADRPDIQALLLARPNWTKAIDVSFLGQLISDQVLLPPAVWKALYQSSDIVDCGSGSSTLLALLLNILARAKFDTSGPTDSWDLPFSAELGELCHLEFQMSLIAITFICDNLVDGPDADADAARDLLVKISSEHVYDADILIHLIICLVDKLRAELAVHEADEEDIRESTDIAQQTLFLLPEAKWCEPLFVIAIQDLNDLKATLNGSPPSSPHSKTSVDTSLAPLMEYMLEILSHPWPLLRSPGFSSESGARILFSSLFDSQDPRAFDVLLSADGLSTLRRCFPVDFVLTDKPENWQLDPATKQNVLHDGLVDYVSYLVGLEGAERDEHLDYLFQPDNLAWLMWNACNCTFYSRLTPSEYKLVRLLHQMRPDIKPWLHAAKILVDELHRDAAYYGFNTEGLLMVYPYEDLQRIFRMVGIRLEGEYSLYAYSLYPAKEMFPSCFIEEDIGSGPLYSPHVYRYAPKWDSFDESSQTTLPSFKDGPHSKPLFVKMKDFFETGRKHLPLSRTSNDDLEKAKKGIPLVPE